MKKRGKILITGAAQRIGAGLVEIFAKEGWDIVLHFNKNRAKAEALSAKLTTASPTNIELLQADLSREKNVFALMEQAIYSSPINVLINNASIFEYDDSTSLSAKSIERHMAINVTAPALLTRAMFQSLGAGDKGVVINILDSKLFGLNPDYYSYTLSKAACATLTNISAQAYAPHLRVNAIAPGIVLPSIGQSEEEFRQAHRRNLLQQSTTISEIASAAGFIIDNPSMTGQTIILDGGGHLQPLSRDVCFVE